MLKSVNLANRRMTLFYNSFVFSSKKLLHYYLQGGILLFVAAKQGDDKKITSKKVIDFNKTKSYNNKVA
ncbi:hypothetical protein FO507_19935 [Bacillus mojavensis]|nr:hypothetical protein [Bacillus mojavensis]